MLAAVIKKAADKTKESERPRRRLSAEDARARILEAAVERLRAEGPQALTLTVLAKELGISHQAILHHFGSRDGLIAAVVHSALQSLETELAAGLAAVNDPSEGAGEVLGRAFEVLADHGHGRLLAWLALGEGTGPNDERRPLEMLARVTHQMRMREQPDASYRDTLFTVMLSAYMTLGAAVFENGTLAAAGLGDDPSARGEFRQWLARVLVEHMRSAGSPPST